MRKTGSQPGAVLPHWEIANILPPIFNRRGPLAVNGFSISLAGPILELNENHDAPEVEITKGLPNRS